MCVGLKQRVNLMADRRVFVSTLMYGLFAFIGVMSLEVSFNSVINLVWGAVCVKY